MRGVIFRTLAGPLAVLFVWVAVAADAARVSLWTRAGAGMMGLVFGAFAAFGTGPAERLLGLFFGDMTGGKGPPPGGTR